MILFDLTNIEIIVLLLSALFVGMGKGGVPGAGMLIIPVTALLFGGKPSTGLLLPILIYADVFAVIYYKRHLNKQHLFRLLPWAIVGVIIALFVGDMLNDDQFLQTMAVVIIAGIVLVLGRDFGLIRFEAKKSKFIAALLGVATGFASMIGNAAGPVVTLYLLAVDFKKNEFIGTRAWVFFTINLVKFPLHIFVWETIDSEIMMLSLWLFPVLILGVFLGIRLIKIIPEKIFKTVVYVTATISTLMLIFKV